MSRQFPELRLGPGRGVDADGHVWDMFMPVPLSWCHGLYIEMKVGRNTLADYFGLEGLGGR